MQILLPLENKIYVFPCPDQLSGFFHDSIAKVCPWCLKTWAIIQHKSKQFSVQPTCCLSCWTPDRGKSAPSWSPVAGSLLDDCGRMGVQWELLDYLPKALLTREFFLHLKAFT